MILVAASLLHPQSALADEAEDRAVREYYQKARAKGMTKAKRRALQNRLMTRVSNERVQKERDAQIRRERSEKMAGVRYLMEKMGLSERKARRVLKAKEGGLKKKKKRRRLRKLASKEQSPKKAPPRRSAVSGTGLPSVIDFNNDSASQGESLESYHQRNQENSAPSRIDF